MDDIFPINEKLYTQDELKILNGWKESQKNEVYDDIPSNIMELLIKDDRYKFFKPSFNFETTSEYLNPDRSLNIMQENLNLFKSMWPSKAAEFINSDPKLKDELRRTDYDLYKKYFPNEA